MGFAGIIMEDTLTGKTIGKYHIEERLGRGGMAEVYKGYQESLDRHVAIKIMHTFLMSEEDFLQRFKREARAMAALSHPNIVRVYDFDVYGEDSYFLVMEYIDGGTLKQKLEELAQTNERLPLQTSVKMITEVADALAYAHRRQMIHRDIKPANIMLRKETGQAVLTDFGIVKLVGTQSMAYTATGALIGTPAYMSPEQAMGQPGDERVDIYSLGVLLFQLVTNQLPFAGDTPLAVVMKHVSEPTPMPMTFNPDIPLDLQEVILKAMAKEPEDRFQNAAEMAAALRAVDFDGPKAVATAIGAGDATAVALPEELTTTGLTMAAQTAVAEPGEITGIPAASPRRKIPAPLLIGGGLILLLLLIGGLLFATGVLGGDSRATPTTFIAIADEDTPTATRTPSPEPTATETAVSAQEEGPDEVATQLALLTMDLTREAEATSTPTRTPTTARTPTATASPTTDATVEFLANCLVDAELVSVNRGHTSSNSVFPGVSFELRWVLENSGTCSWPETVQWTYVEGETFGYEGDPIPLQTAVAAGEQTTLLATVTSPVEAGAYESTWQLADAGGEPFGPPLEFTFFVVPRETPTPTRTPTPQASPTSDVVAGQAAYIFTVGTCDYPGDGPDWRCQLTITPYLDGSDGAGGQFTVFVFDQPGGQAATYRGTGPFTHFITARRCAAYNHEIRVVEDLTATEVSGQIYVDPDDYFEGGCTQP